MQHKYIKNLSQVLTQAQIQKDEMNFTNKSNTTPGSA